MSRSFRVELPAGLPLLNANGREHWSKRANATKAIRTIACGQAKGIPPLAKVRVKAIFYAPDNRRRDVSNLFPAIKAAIDGALVDSKVLPDDSDKYVKSLEIVRAEDNIPGGQLVIEVIEAE